MKESVIPANRLCHNYMKRRFVILNEVKNLIGSMSSVGEILRLHLRMTLRHSLEGGYPKFLEKKWIPVSTGMTTKDRNAVFQQAAKRQTWDYVVF